MKVFRHLGCLLALLIGSAPLSASPITFDFSDAALGPGLLGFGSSATQTVDGFTITLDLAGGIGTIGADATVFQFASTGINNVGITVADASTGSNVDFVLESIDFGNTFGFGDTTISSSEFTQIVSANTTNGLLETTVISSDALISAFSVAFDNQTGALGFPAISNVVISGVSVVPEPVTASLAMFGATALCVFRRRK